jgi:hypothetical protein
MFDIQFVAMNNKQYIRSDKAKLSAGSERKVVDLIRPR